MHDLTDLAEALATECRSSEGMTEEIQRLALAVLRKINDSRNGSGEWTVEDILAREG